MMMYDIKKAGHQRTGSFELQGWRRLLRVPWTARRSNQSALKEINPEYSLERLMLKLKPQYFSPLMWRADSLEKTLMLGKIEDRKRRGDRGWDGWMESSTQWTWVWANSGRWWRIGKPGVLQSMGSQRVGRCLATEQQQQSSKVPTATNGKSVSIGHFQRNSWTSTSSILPNYCILVQYVQWILPQHNTDVLPYCS